MKKFLIAIFTILFISSANAQLFRRISPEAAKYEPSDAEITVGRYRPLEKNLDFVLETYTDGELRNYATMVNNLAIEQAEKNGEPIPAELSEETLKSRKNIENYLRSYFNIPY